MQNNISSKDLLTKKGLKNTVQRKEILQVLSEADIPLTAREVYLKLKDNEKECRLSTIYRNLNIFEEKNIIKKVIINHNNINHNKHSFFELIKKEDYHYFICTKCGKITNIKCPLAEYLGKLAEEKDYTITDHRLIIYGICSECH